MNTAIQKLRKQNSIRPTTDQILEAIEEHGRAMFEFGQIFDDIDSPDYKTRFEKKQTEVQNKSRQLERCILARLAIDANV